MGWFGRGRKKGDGIPSDPSDTFDIGGVTVVTTTNARKEFVVSKTAGDNEDWRYISGLLSDNFDRQNFSFQVRHSGDKDYYSLLISPQKTQLTYDSIVQSCKELERLLPDRDTLNDFRKVQARQRADEKREVETMLLEKKAMPYLEATREILKDRGDSLNEQEEAKLLAKFVKITQRER